MYYLVWDRTIQESFSPILPNKTVTIGRRNSSDVVISNGKVSRDHARIERYSDGSRLIDLSSKNGTTVNGTAVDRSVLLVDGDRISFGGATAAVYRVNLSGEELEVAFGNRIDTFIG